MGVLEGNVLVTGATGGIGAAIARALAVRGAHVIVSGRQTEVLEELASELQGRSITADLADPAQVQRLVAEAGDVDVLVANAGLPASGLITEFSQSQIDTMLAVNLQAPIALARALVPSMIERARGHLVFISSLSGRVTSPQSSVYSATKFGLRGFALGLRQDLADSGVGVSVVMPGFISQAGMFAEAGVALPRGVATRTPEQVAEGVIRAVERNRAEVDVAPLPLRLGADVASVAPQLAARLSRRSGGDQIAAALAEAHRAQRPPEG